MSSAFNYPQVFNFCALRRGQVWLSDDDSDFSSPERYYTYDCQGRRKAEEQWYEASHHLFSTTIFISFCACATGGCGGDIAGDFVAQTYTFNAAGGVDHHIEHMIGLGAHGTGSSSATHPAAVFGPGGRPAGDAIVAERVTRGAVEHVYWRCEDQLNSCVGQIDENGWRTMQTSYLAFGEALQSRVLFDGALSRLSAVEHDGLALTTITLAANELADDELNGALLFLARPGYNGDRHMEAVVVDSTANTIVVEDLTGALFEALGPEGRPIADFVIFAFNDSKQANSPTYQTQGTWTSAPSYASSQTTFTDIDADDNGGGFASWMIGALLVPDTNIGAPLVVVSATATTLVVAGDARGVAGSGSQYIVYAAPFTDPAHGTNEMDPHNGGTRYLWAGYRYQPPQMGFWVDPPGAPSLGVYGAATGTNKLGQYYCWNRIYDIATGRWTTPDPVATPWWNLGNYCWTSPTKQTDVTGHFSVRIRETLGGESTGTENKLRDAMKKLAGVDVDTESNADEDDILEGLEKTDEDDVFVYYGHSADTDGDGKTDTLMEHDSFIGCVAGGAAIGGLLGPVGGLLGGAIGAAVSANDPINKDDFAKAAKKAKGTVIIFGCRGCDLKFENAKCVICYEGEASLQKATADMAAMAKVIDEMKPGQCKTWTQIANAATQEGGKKIGAIRGADAETLKASAGCAKVNVCK